MRRKGVLITLLFLWIYLVGMGMHHMCQTVLQF